MPDATTAAPGGRNNIEYLWSLGPQLSTDGITPLRGLYKPSKDGFRYDAWSDGVGMDCDSGSDFDACDMGAMAHAYGGFDHLEGIYPAANLYGRWNGVDDICVELLCEGFNNAFKH